MHAIFARMSAPVGRICCRSLAQLILLMAATSAQNVFAQDCPDLSGTWTVTETITLTITINGESETITQSATNIVELTQNGCTVRFFRSIPLPDGSTFQAERVGVIEGDTVTFTGIAAVPLEGVTCSQNSFVAVGTIDGNRIDATTTVDVRCTAPGIVQTVTGNGTAVFIGPPPPDQDGDGVPDDEDAFPNDPTETTDTDGDGIGNNADTDDDGDGMPDDFELANNLDPLDAADAATDADGDGFTNLEESQAGTNPQNAADYPGKKKAPIAIFIILGQDEE